MHIRSETAHFISAVYQLGNWPQQLFSSFFERMHTAINNVTIIVANNYKNNIIVNTQRAFIEKLKMGLTWAIANSFMFLLHSRLSLFYNSCFKTDIVFFFKTHSYTLTTTKLKDKLKSH